MIQMFLALLAIHWIADFVLQTHWQASNKSKNWWALTSHVLTYTTTLAILTALAMIFIPGIVALTFPIWLGWIALNGVLHFAVDSVTSRITSRLFGKDWHNFFVVVGFDQLLHYFCLIGTLLVFL